ENMFQEQFFNYVRTDEKLGYSCFVVNNIFLSFDKYFNFIDFVVISSNNKHECIIDKINNFIKNIKTNYDSFNNIIESLELTLVPRDEPSIIIMNRNFDQIISQRYNFDFNKKIK